MNKRQRDAARQREMEREREAPTLWDARPVPWANGGLRNALDKIKDNTGKCDMAACYARFLAERDGQSLSDASCFIAEWHTTHDDIGVGYSAPRRKLFVRAIVFHKGRPPSSSWYSGYYNQWRSEGEIARVEIPNPDARKAHWVRQVSASR